MKLVTNISFFLLFVSTASSQELKDLVGRWERIEGDFIGMRIEVDYKTGVLLTSSDNNYFEEGDVKWKDLVQIEDGQFGFKSLLI